MKKTAEQSARKKTRKIIIPPAIQKGDTIGLVSPAGPLVNKSNFTAGINILEKKGFKTKYNRRLLHTKGYLAGADHARAHEFNRLWADPEVKALVATRGGYGCLRMLDFLEMKLIRKKPKIFVGFSDLTVLLAAINKKTGLVTYHGPVITTLATSDRKSQKSFLATLTDSTISDIDAAKVKVLKGGKARGVLLGGNLTTLVHMIATPYEIPWDQAILFIEDIGEFPYRLDRLLTHLDQAGRLQKIRGLILGTFSDNDRKENRAMKNAVQKRVLELLEKKDIPIWANFPTGHSRRNLTLPIGVYFAMNSSDRSLRPLANHDS
ncbi:MAG: LD-carboxypeptidase [Desulfobulbales bacterium]|nr:LD-carboxypeptidase [Desulfobulbales bacterium]